MKALKTIVVSFILMVVFPISGGISHVEASDYLGEFCWQIEADGRYIILRLAVTDKGNGHYLLNGREIDLEDGSIQATLGSAEIVGDKVYTVTTGAGSNKFETFSSCSTILDLATLNGNTEAIITFYDKTTEEIWMEYRSGTVTFIPCEEVVGLSVEKVQTKDLSNSNKRTFEPGEDVRYHVSFTITGTDNYYVVAEGKAFNLSDTDWSTKFSREETLSAGTYHWHWDKIIPSEATPGSEAKVRIVLKIFDTPGGTLLSQDRDAKKFSIERPE